MKGQSLKSIREIEVSGKPVLVRGDFDVDDGDNPRVGSVRQIVRFLAMAGASRIKVIGHRGEYPVGEELQNEFPGAEFDDRLREDPGEKSNSGDLAKKLAEGFEVYVNEAFATSHREHCSVAALPKLMKRQKKDAGVGLRFEMEVERLGEVWSKPGRKVLVLGGGSKALDKIGYAQKLADKVDVILLGGRLPLEIRNTRVVNPKYASKFKIASLREDEADIDSESVKMFEEEIKQAKLIVAGGVMGKYEEKSSFEGTRKVLEAIANTKAYKVAGGGDIERAIDMLRLSHKFDWISVGGGAMLEFLAEGTLPGIEALGD